MDNKPADSLREKASALVDYLWGTRMEGIPFHLVSDLRAALATKPAEPPEPPAVPEWINDESGPDAWNVGWKAGWEARGAASPPIAQRGAPEPQWPKKRDLAASLRISQQRYEIDLMWNNAIDLCRRAAAQRGAALTDEIEWLSDYCRRPSAGDEHLPHLRRLLASL